MKKIRLLLDENLSPETAIYLRLLGYEAVTVADVRLSSADDESIVKYAIKHHYCIVTLDLDFGTLFYMDYQNKLGIIVLRLVDQTVESVNGHLLRLLTTSILSKPKNQKALIIVDEKHIRVRTL